MYSSMIDRSFSWPAIVALIAIFALMYWLRSSKPELQFPSVGDPQSTDCRSALEIGAKKFPNTPWVLPLQDPLVILPQWAINEIKSLPENQVSLNQELYIRFLGRYTLLGQEDDEIVAVIKHDLARGLPEIFDTILIPEAVYSMNLELGPCPDWTCFTVFEKASRIVTMLNGRTFVGLPLSREEDWINSTIMYTTEGDIVAQSLRPYPSMLRYFVAPFLSTVKSLKKHQALVSEKTRPLIEAHLKSHSSSTDSKRSQGSANSGKLINWLLARYSRAPTAAVIAKDYLLSSAASVPIPASLLTHVLFELASRPEYVSPLRAELEEMMQKSKEFNFTSLPRLDKMDSFIKECQRLNSHGLTMLTRRTTSTITLSDGSVIPKGVSVGISNYTINHSPEYYPDPEDFKGFRFSDLRKFPGNAGKFQFVGTSTENLNWGYGNHACPGRHFAGAEIKLCLSYILSNYDVKLSDEGRPDNMIFGVLVVPSPFGKLLFKSRCPIPGIGL